MTSARAVAALYTAAISVAAALLFLVQPMVGKLVLPRAGGSPQVWNTSLLFFQTALLLGYLYAHVSVKWLGVKAQAVAHLVVLALPLVVLPIALPEGYPPTGGQVGWILEVLSLAVGAPFVVLAAASPLLQRWLASTDHPAAADPYFLYAGSNAGSLVGLLVFPLVLEPLLPLSAQSRLWMAGYLVFVALAVACAVVLLRQSGPPAAAPAATRPTGAADQAPTGKARLYWLACAAVPSALLLGVTQYLTSQIAPFSLLWVLPLAVYLITFIAAFARRRLVSMERLSRLMAIVTVAIALMMLSRLADPAWAVTALHLALLAVAGLLCHGRLADARPPASHLTEYYLIISAGGALGGTFGALVAPYAFDFIAEYPIAVVLACLFRIPFAAPPNATGLKRVVFHGKTLDFVLPAALAIYVLAASLGTRAVPEVPDGVMVILVAVVPTLVCFVFSPRPVRFALGVAVLLITAESGQMFRGDILHTERTFFGVHRVIRDPGNSVHILYHGSIVHGVQSVDPERATEPLAYYHPSGPAGSFMRAFAGQQDKREVALVGAGTGALAVLAAPHQHVTLYEIDPEVMRIAHESEWFSYLEHARATLETVIGDGRIELSRTDARYDAIVLDAFSSGSIPVHLLTREAFDLYLDRLAPGGVLLFHISNRHLDLAPVLGSQAREHGLSAWEWQDVKDDSFVERGIFGSEWVLMARRPEDVRYVPAAGWKELPIPRDRRAWTDDFSDLLSVQRWR